METNENFGQTNSSGGLVLTLEAQNYLRESGKWAYFLGILGFIGTGLILLAALSVSTIFALIEKFQPQSSQLLPGFGNMAGVGGILSVVYLLIAVIYFFFSLFLFQFGNNIKKGITYGDLIQVNKALGKLKSFFKLWGITTIVVIVIYILVIIGVVIAAIGAATMLHK